MAKLKPLFFLLIIIAITVGGAFLMTRSSQPLGNPTVHTYYWGDGCPHCENVDKFVESWSGKDKLEIDKKEVWNNPVNAKELSERYRSICKIANPAEMGVPLLVTPDGKCFNGDTPIIKYYESLNL